MTILKIVGLGLIATIVVFTALLIKGIVALEKEITAEKNRTSET